MFGQFPLCFITCYLKQNVTFPYGDHIPVVPLSRLYSMCCVTHEKEPGALTEKRRGSKLRHSTL